jgi:hypothetical protein
LFGLGPGGSPLSLSLSGSHQSNPKQLDSSHLDDQCEATKSRANRNPNEDERNLNTIAFHSHAEPSPDQQVRQVPIAGVQPEQVSNLFQKQGFALGRRSTRIHQGEPDFQKQKQNNKNSYSVVVVVSLFVCLFRFRLDTE